MSRLFPVHPEAKKRRTAMLRRRLTALLVVLALGALLLSYIGIRFSGEWLVLDQPVVHVPWVAVLDGQSDRMERSDYTVNLLTTGKADSVVLLGKRIFRDRNAADFYLEDMLKQGNIDPSRIFLLRHNDNSSIGEAFSLIPALKTRGVDSVLLITSGAASRRVNRIFNRLAGGSPVFFTVDIADPLYSPRTWIHNRESRKIWLKEWASYLVSFWELAWEKPIQLIEGKPYNLDPAIVTTKMEEPLMPILAAVSSETMSSSSVTLSSSSSSEKQSSAGNAALPELDSAEVVKDKKSVKKDEKSKESAKSDAEKKSKSSTSPDTKKDASKDTKKDQKKGK